jgi:hypothetical protein
MTKKTEIRTRAEVKRLMLEYYSKNRVSFPRWIKEFREEIIALIESGGPPSVIFDESAEIELPNTLKSFAES